MIWGNEVAGAEIAAGIQKQAFQRGLLVELCGSRSDVVKIAPPLTIDEELFLDGLARIRESFVASTRTGP